MKLIPAGLMAGAAALTVLALSAPAQAQDDADVTAPPALYADVRPLAGMDERRIVQFLEEFSRSPEVAEVGKLIDKEVFKAGKKVPGWQDSGIDIIAELAAREGGLAANLLRDQTGQIPGVTDFSGTAQPDLQGFATLAVRPAPAGANERSFTSISPGIWVALDHRRTRRGNGLCYNGTVGVTILSAAPFAQWDELATFGVAGLIAGLDKMGEREFCAVYERNGDGYAIRGYRPDGRRLGKLDDTAIAYRIMPAAALSAYLREATPSGYGE